MISNHKGYALFLDIESRSTRISNQAVVLANIFEDHLEQTGVLKDKGVSARGVSLVLGYFNNISQEDKSAVTRRYKEVMEERGFMEVLA
jgi:hypothetical protein